MNLLSELKGLITSLGIQVETGVFKDKAPDEYIVITPLADTFGYHADDLPYYDLQRARVSLFSKDNYLMSKYKIVFILQNADFVITDRRYIGYEGSTGYHHWLVDVIKEYEFMEE